MKRRQEGFAVWIILLAVVVLGVAGFGGYRLYSANKEKPKQADYYNSKFVIYTLPETTAIIKDKTLKFSSGVSTDNGLEISQVYYKGNVASLNSEELDKTPSYLTLLQSGVTPNTPSNGSSCASLAHYAGTCTTVGKTSSGNEIIRYDHTSQDESDNSTVKPSVTFSSDINTTRLSLKFWANTAPTNEEVIALFGQLQKTEYNPDSFYPSQIPVRYIP